MKLSVVSYLDETATKQVRVIQQELSKLTGSTASLNSWFPHITIGDGVEVSSAGLPYAASSLAELCSATPCFTLGIRGYGGLTDRRGGTGEVSTPFALYLNIEPNDLLTTLVRDIQSQVTASHSLWWQMRQPYQPHITVAFRDLDERGYELGTAYLQKSKVELSSTIDHVALVEKLETVDTEYKRFLLAR